METLHQSPFSREEGNDFDEVTHLLTYKKAGQILKTRQKPPKHDNITLPFRSPHALDQIQLHMAVSYQHTQFLSSALSTEYDNEIELCYHTLETQQVRYG